MLTRALTLLGLATLASSCASMASEEDALCSEIAEFANASSPSNPHTVRLTTDWGGVYTDTDPNESVMGAMWCQQDQSRATKNLCAYLIENTSFEFAAINYRHVLRCLGVNTGDHDDMEGASLPPSARSGTVNGKRVRSEVTAAFTRATDRSPPVLSISAGVP